MSGSSSSSSSSTVASSIVVTPSLDTKDMKISSSSSSSSSTKEVKGNKDKSPTWWSRTCKPVEKKTEAKGEKKASALESQDGPQGAANAKDGKEASKCDASAWKTAGVVGFIIATAGGGAICYFFVGTVPGVNPASIALFAVSVVTLVGGSTIAVVGLCKKKKPDNNKVEGNTESKKNLTDSATSGSGAANGNAGDKVRRDPPPREGGTSDGPPAELPGTGSRKDTPPLASSPTSSQPVDPNAPRPPAPVTDPNAPPRQ